MRAILLIFAATLVAAVAAHDKKIVCYWGSWSVYRQGDGQFDLSFMDPKLCTHMIYTFIGLSPNGKVKILDPWCDLADGGGKNNIARFNQLREQNPSLKTMIAIGGWNEGSTVYSKVVADHRLRRTMVESIYNFVKEYNFDGFDVDWEYPAQREGSSPADKRNYVLLLKELRERFDEDGLILSAAVGAAESSASQSYDIPKISKYLHFINLMAYDLHGSWDKKTGHNAAVYAASSETGGHATLNVDAVINYWLSQGAPSEKLVLGVPLYGRSFTLSNPRSHGVGAPASAGSPGPYTKEPGMLGYNEICEKITFNNWKVKYDEERKAVYAYKGNQWVSYDDEKIIKEKTDYIKEYNLGGAMVWSIETDDFRGNCGEKFPLLNALYRELGNENSWYPDSPYNPKESIKPKPQQPQYPQNNQDGAQGYPNYSSEEAISDDSDQYPQQPQQSQQPSYNGQVCQAEGYARHPQDCNKFYYCQYFNDNFVEHPMSCPANLHYDSAQGLCNWPEAVQC